MANHDLRIALEMCPWRKAPPWLGVDRALGAWMAWRCVRPVDCSVMVVDAGTVLSLTRVTRQVVLEADWLICGLSASAPGHGRRNPRLAFNSLRISTTTLLRDGFPTRDRGAMQRGVVESLLALIAQAQQQAQGLLWICGGDAALLMSSLVRCLVVAAGG